MATKARRSRSRATVSQTRAARRARRHTRRRFVRYGAVIAVGAVAAAFIVALFLPGLPISIGGSAPEGPGLRIPNLGGTHINPDQGHPPYNSVPATSGWHYAQPHAPARWGAHDEVLPDEVLVHNLEHGGVGVHYNCPEGCPQLVEQLSSIVRRADEVIMSPYPDMDTRIALTAWNYIDKFDILDAERVEDFIRGHMNSQDAPEPGGF